MNMYFFLRQLGPNPITTNTSSDQSMMDDGMSRNSEEKRTKSTKVMLLTPSRI